MGDTTCGKPYGFFAADNCGTTYFAIQFVGVNDLGLGNYSDGFAANCAATDDFRKPLGDPAEGQLATALRLNLTGACVPNVSSASTAERARIPAATTDDPETIRYPRAACISSNEF